MNIAIFVYDGAEVLDFSGPFEVFATAERVSDEVDLFSVFLVAEKPGPVAARAGYMVTPKYDFASHPPIDVLIVVGGVHDAELTKPKVIQWIAEQSATATLVASVCTGAFLLAEAGVAERQTVTTHWDDIEGLRESYPALDVVEDQRWVDAGDLVTSAGISAGIDMSLYLVSRFAGQALAEKTARVMEYDWVKQA